jgi:hypothetical protein
MEEMGMYYLRKEPYEKTIAPIEKTDETVIPERKYMTEDRTVYKHHDFSRFYRQEFIGINERLDGMKVYTCKTLKTIMELRQSTYDYCHEWFDVYDENGKVEIVHLSAVGRRDYIAWNGNVCSIDKILGLIFEGKDTGEIYLIDKKSFEEEQIQIFEQACKDHAKGVKNGSYPVKSPLTPIYIDVKQSNVQEAFCCSLCESLVIKDGTGNEICPKHNTREHFSRAYTIVS